MVVPAGRGDAESRGHKLMPYWPCAKLGLGSNEARKSIWNELPDIKTVAEPAGKVSAWFDALGFIERPVNAEIDPTLAVLAPPGRPRADIGLANPRDRPPKLVVILRLPGGGAGITHREIDERLQPRPIDDARETRRRNLHRDLVIEPRRRAQARRAVVRPEDPDGLGARAGAQGQQGAAARGDRITRRSRTASRRTANQANNNQPTYVDTRLYAKKHVYEDILSNGICLFGAVETVTTKMCRLHEMGIRHVATMHNFGNLPVNLVERSMTLFARDVMPAVAARVGAAALAS